MLREMIESGAFVAAPGVFDGFSAMLAQRSACKAVYMGGYCVAASRWALPDAGIIGLAEMLDAIRVLRRACDKPLIADGDTGYGGLVNIQHTVREYEKAGVNAVHFEDQEMPKRCGHTQGKRVIPAEEMAMKIAVAVETRGSDDFLIIARTDSRQMLGLDEALRRVRLYQEAGADLLFVDAPESFEEVERIAAEGPRPAMINMVPPRDFKTPQISARRLHEMGFALGIYPGMLVSPGLAAMEASLDRFFETGEMDPAAPGVSPHELVGFPRVWADEARWSARFSPAGEDEAA